MKEENKIPQYLIEAKKDALTNCTMLYEDLHKPCTETCMCWSWEFRSGWNEVIKDLSYNLEALNLYYYPKYKTKIVFEQTKEKWGLFTGYYSIRTTDPFYVTIWHKPFSSLWRYLSRNIDYGYKTIIDKPEYITHEKDEISKEEYEELIKDNPNSTRYINENDKYYKVYDLTHMARRHKEPTKHKLLHKFKDIIWDISNALDFTCKCSKEQEVIIGYLDYMASKLIKEAEDKCYNTCEVCGRQIGYEWSPRCETTGWIKYLCEDCAKENGRYYIKDHKKYDSSGNEVKKDENKAK